MRNNINATCALCIIQLSIKYYFTKEYEAAVGTANVELKVSRELRIFIFSMLISPVH